mgnify:CR=1 FL=1
MPVYGRSHVCHAQPFTRGRDQKFRRCGYDQIVRAVRLRVKRLDPAKCFRPECVHRAVHIIDMRKERQKPLLEILLFSNFQREKNAVHCLLRQHKPQSWIMLQTVQTEQRRAIPAQNGIVKIVYIHILGRLSLHPVATALLIAPVDYGRNQMTFLRAVLASSNYRVVDCGRSV